METGSVVVAKTGGKSTVIRCFSKYPLKFIVPSKVLLEQGFISTIAECMQDYQVIAMVIILGPKLKQLQNQVQESVKSMMSGYFQAKSTASGFSVRSNSNTQLAKPSFVASCSAFSPKGLGLIVRIAAVTTESVYQFLHLQLACLAPLIGATPYS